MSFGVPHKTESKMGLKRSIWFVVKRSMMICGACVSYWTHSEQQYITWKSLNLHCSHYTSLSNGLSIEEVTRGSRFRAGSNTQCFTRTSQRLWSFVYLHRMMSFPQWNGGIDFDNFHWFSTSSFTVEYVQCVCVCTSSSVCDARGTLRVVTVNNTSEIWISIHFFLFPLKPRPAAASHCLTGKSHSSAGPGTVFSVTITFWPNRFEYVYLCFTTCFRKCEQFWVLYARNSLL